MKINIKKVDGIGKKIMLLSLQAALILEILGIGILSKSLSLYQYQLSVFIMQTAIIVLVQGLIFGGLISKFLKE